MHDLATPTFIETMREKDMRMSRWSLVFADQFVEVQYRKWMLLHRHTSVTIFWLTAAVVYGVLLLAFDLITWRPTDADPSTGWGVVWTVCTLQFVLVSIRWCLLCQRDSTYRANLSLLLFSTTLFGCGSIVARWGLHSASLQEFPLTSFASGIGDVVAFMVLLASPNLSPFTFHHHAILVVVMGVCRLVLVSMSIAGADWMASGVTDSAADEVVGSTVISLVASTLVIIVVAYRHDMKHRDSFSEQWWDLVEKELANKSAPTDQLSALTDTIRTGQLRALYVKAMTNSKGSASAKLKLHSFVHNSGLCVSCGCKVVCGRLTLWLCLCSLQPVKCCKALMQETIGSMRRAFMVAWWKLHVEALTLCVLGTIVLQGPRFVNRGECGERR